MQKKIILISILFFTLFSCEQKEPEEIITINEIKPEIPPVDDFNYDTLKGIYSGDFGGSDIRIVLNYVNQTNAIGYNIHKGLQRNLSGKVEKIGDSIKIILNEPGDNKYDGVFTLNLIGDYQKLTGNWVANDSKYGDKDFVLHKKVKLEYESFKKLTADNFSMYIDLLEDTTGTYNLSDDGLCRYDYYPSNDGVEQLVSILGSWTFKNNQLIFDWQPNEYFKNSQTIYNYFYNENESYPEPSFMNEDDTLYLMYW